MITENNGLFHISIKALAIFMSIYHLYSIVEGRTEPYFYRFTHLALALLLGYLLLAMKKDGFNRIYASILGISTVFVYIYFYINYERLIVLIPGLHTLTRWDIFMGVILILLVLEGTRMYIGWLLSLVSVIFLIYAFTGPYLPGLLHHRGLSFAYMIHYLTFTFEGIFGIAIAISSSYIILFLIFGSFLRVSGVGDYFIKLATALAGGARGGPAKIAVLSSAFIGSIIGSPSSNVAITGTFTIPLMKKNGFKTDFSAAVEAAASTGGLILPPIMGSTAFIMAEILGITYAQVARASLIPAVMYFLAILIMVDIHAVKNNLIGLPKQERPALNVTLKQCYKLLPLPVIIIMLIKGYSPIFAGLAGIISCLILGIFNTDNKLSFTRILEALERASITAVQIILACAASGVIIGAIALTGLTGKFSSILLQLSGGIEILVLFFIMISTIILGMGLAITPAYIMAAVLGAPALISLGFTPIAAHLFILYFAVLAPLTPPFAITAYVAANIAEGNMGKTALQALLLVSSGFLIPYIFIYHNELLMIGWGVDIFISIATAIIGITCFAGGVQGFLVKNLNIYQRATAIVGGLLIVAPGILSDLAGLFMLSIILFSSREIVIEVRNRLKLFLRGG